MEGRHAIFLDRDGTVIADTGYIGDPSLIEFLPDVFDALRQFRDAGYILVVVSNQSGIGRGVITQNQYDQVAARLDKLLASEGLEVKTYYCSHSPDDSCLCRKPRPDLLLQAAAELGLELSRSFMIGDRGSDVEAGAAAGCKTILLRTPQSQVQSTTSAVTPDFVCADWSCVAAVIPRQ